MNKKLFLDVNPSAFSLLKKESKSCKHFDNKIISTCLESGRVIECLHFSLNMIGYELKIIGDLFLDIPQSKRVCDIQRFELKALSLLECAGASKLSEIAHKSKWASPASILTVLALNPYLATCFDSNMPVLALNKGWNTHKSIPILYADNSNKIIYITRGFPADGPTGWVSVLVH